MNGIISGGTKNAGGRGRDRLYVFIDAANLWQAQKAKGRFFDFEKLRGFLKKTFNAIEIQIFYYDAYPGEGTRDYSLEVGSTDFIPISRRGYSL